jgi:ribosomal protein S18 acetylase RimI-like enzyme
MDENTMRFREAVRDEDRENVRMIVDSTGFFNPEEVGIAVELVDARLSMGPESGYEFLFAELGGKVVGYMCYGRIPGTEASFYLYWIAVEQGLRGRGIGKELMAKTEELIANRGGRRVYLETSSRGQYESTRSFYLRCGYAAEALLKDFYSPGDGKVIFVKAV